MVLCINNSGQVAIVISRTNRSTTYVITVKNKRKLVTDRNVDFDRYFKLYGNDPVKAIVNWLTSPLKMSQELKRRLEMIVTLNKQNKVTGVYENEADVPSGTTQITGPEDLNGRSVKSLTGLYNKLSGPEVEGIKQFATVEEATTAVWGVMEQMEFTKVREQKKVESKPKEKIELLEIPKRIGKLSVITNIIENPKRGAARGRFDLYQEGMTVAEALVAGIRTDDIRWDAQRKFIAVEYIDDPPKPVKEKVVKEEETPTE